MLAVKLGRPHQLAFAVDGIVSVNGAGDGDGGVVGFECDSRQQGGQMSAPTRSSS